MTAESKSPLESASDLLGGLQEQAQSVIGDLAENAEKMADGILGEATVDQVKAVLNSDVVDLAQDLIGKVTGKDEP